MTCDMPLFVWGGGGVNDDFKNWFVIWECGISILEY